MVTRIDADVASILEQVTICHENHPDTFKECIQDNVILRFGTVPLDEAVGTVDKTIGRETALSASQKNVLWQEYIASMNRKGLMDNDWAEKFIKIRHWVK